MSCDHDCERPPPFPVDVWNRPALDHFAYRIGRYPQIRGHMLDQLVKAPALQAWSHLDSDDPGIALLEGAALIGDLLTFYQELYANETKLGTASWEESVHDLVRLVGYRPAPGIGGEARFAVEVDGAAPVMIPAGFPFEAALEGTSKPAKFESSKAIVAHPELGRFHLYRPRLRAAITMGLNQLDIVSVGGASGLAVREAAELGVGDRLILISDPAAFDDAPSIYTSQPRSEIAIVKAVDTLLDRVRVTFEGTLGVDRASPVTAFKIGRTFRHFGADVPSQFPVYTDSPPSVQRLQTDFQRRLNLSSRSTTGHSALAANTIPLDREIDDLPVGAPVVCEGIAHSIGVPWRPILPKSFTVVRQVARVTPGPVVWGNVEANVTHVALDRTLMPDLDLGSAVLLLSFSIREYDIRKLRVHETLGPELLLEAPPEPTRGAFTDGRLNYFGTREAAKALAGRCLLIQAAEESQFVTVADELPEVAAAAPEPPDDRRMWPITLTALPEAPRPAFDEAEPETVVYGNLIPATEGKTEDELILGNGDGREVFQTFTLPKELTYLSDPATTPPFAPELEVRVAGRLWQPVPSFFNQPPEAQIFILRKDDDGADVIQFGDGINGARLPSGRGNVTAIYRFGSGARGPLANGAEAKAKGRLRSLTKVHLPTSVTGGADPETANSARIAAPAGLQSLGRLVGLSDYEAEVMAIPGVVKTQAAFREVDGVSVIALAVLTEDESEESVASVEAAIRRADRCRGPARHPVLVQRGQRVFVSVKLRLGYDPELRTGDLESAIAKALGAVPPDGPEPGGGVFALGPRRFGQDAHVSQVVAAAQQVAGITWVRAIAFARLGTTATGDPADLAFPRTDFLGPRLGAEPHQILALSTHHLEAAFALFPEAECA